MFFFQNLVTFFSENLWICDIKFPEFHNSSKSGIRKNCLQPKIEAPKQGDHLLKWFFSSRRCKKGGMPSASCNQKQAYSIFICLFKLCYLAALYYLKKLKISKYLYCIAWISNFKSTWFILILYEMCNLEVKSLD